ncbi:Bug family tripartite tricarboxylate transporter substrate binding protein [Oceanibium sediminis]|uniref:Bug family tripartite tricarboxylate transporter substrate binding protein n=1 Tax=Oceanibium sediminis TaxID=2026339 RepID=UPI000DD4DF2A|nr:tripartite tricarboxylate transporter substrate binding protein [Oceanibium sediminis]
MTFHYKTTLAAIALAVGAGPLAAEDFPSKPIELIVPYGAGGLTDAFARAIARAAEAELPNEEKIVVVNKPGGGATIGLTAAVNAEPDGHTVVFLTASPLVIQPLYGKTQYTTDDFQAISRFYDIPSSINVRADSEIQTYEQWLEWVKANPGDFTYGTSGGTGSGGHISAEELAGELGVELRHIPFEGSAQLTTSIMGGQIEGTNQLPDLHRGGEIRPIVFVTPTKPADAVYDNIPTTRDLGLDAEVIFFSGIVGDKDIPAERVAILDDAFRAAMESPEVQDLFTKYQLTPDYAGPEEFGQIIDNAVARNEATMKRLGLIE